MVNNCNLIKDELPAEGDGGKEDSFLLIPWAEDDGLPRHVLGYCVGAEVEAETGQHQVQDDLQAGQEVAVCRLVYHICSTFSEKPVHQKRCFSSEVPNLSQMYFLNCIGTVLQCICTVICPASDCWLFLVYLPLARACSFHFILF